MYDEKRSVFFWYGCIAKMSKFRAAQKRLRLRLCLLSTSWVHEISGILVGLQWYISIGLGREIRGEICRTVE